MNIETIIEEGEKLVRPCVILREGPLNDRTTGIWGGTAPLFNASKRMEHWISIDCSWLKHIGIHASGLISVFHDSETDKWVATIDQNGNLRDKISHGIPLEGFVSSSFPPLEAFCLYGGPLVERWLASLRRQRLDFRDPKVYDSDIGQAYNEEFQSRSPLYIGRADAVIGGWHIMWPDSNTYDEYGLQLYLWTLRDAEPWIEVWQHQNQLKAVIRIT